MDWSLLLDRWRRVLFFLVIWGEARAVLLIEPRLRPPATDADATMLLFAVE